MDFISFFDNNGIPKLYNIIESLSEDRYIFKYIAYV